MANKCEHCGSVVCEYCGRNDCHGKTECIEAKVRRLEGEVNDLKNRHTIIINQPAVTAQPYQPYGGYPEPWKHQRIYWNSNSNFGATCGQQINDNFMQLLGGEKE